MLAADHSRAFLNPANSAFLELHLQTEFNIARVGVLPKTAGVAKGAFKFAFESAFGRRWMEKSRVKPPRG